MTPQLLDQVLVAHGSSLKWFEYSKASARVTIEGAVWADTLETPAFADTAVEILTQEESVSMTSLTRPGLRSVFTPNVVQIETPGEDTVETRYNPKSTFEEGGSLADWDIFQMAYVCSSSIWNCLTQPFLFSFSGFETEEVPSVTVGNETWRAIRIEYASYIASPSSEILCYIGEDGLMRRQDFKHQSLGGRTISSFMSDYRQIQGLWLPLRRNLYLTTDLGQGEAASPMFASITIADLVYS